MLTRVHSSAADNISKINSSKGEDSPSQQVATGLGFDGRFKHNFTRYFRVFDGKRVMACNERFPNRL